jgi:hypothetical protein
VSISTTFFALLFCKKVSLEAFKAFEGLNFFLAQEYRRKCAHKMLVELTTAMNIEIWPFISSLSQLGSGK